MFFDSQVFILFPCNLKKWDYKNLGVSWLIKQKTESDFYASFSMKVKNGDNNDGEQTVDITVYEYFAEHCGIELTSSAYLPCLDVGKPNRPIYLPLEVCLIYAWVDLVLVPIVYQLYHFSVGVLPLASMVSDYYFLPPLSFWWSSFVHLFPSNDIKRHYLPCKEHLWLKNHAKSRKIESSLWEM